ncbi:putative RNA recognition motif domain, nucleotide-binding alpha-beta plait domain superfamily [Helianthus anomalus]
MKKFYVTNLPTGCNPWDVSEFVKVFSEVVGVYIARKKDKEGRKFGFISFRNANDIKEIKCALNGTKIGGFRHKENLAKYAMENVGLLGDSSEDKDNSKVQDMPP